MTADPEAPTRTLVLVLATRRDPYPMLIDAIERTWAAVDVPGMDVLFYYGGDRCELVGRHLTLNAPDDLPNVGRKTIACLEYVLAQREFDFVFRTNCSSYVDLPNLASWLAANGRSRRFYAGKGLSIDGIRFLSGNGYVLSRDLVELAVEKRDEWNHDYLDDVALGQVMARADVTTTFAPRPIVQTVRAARCVDTSQFVFRCKTDTRSRKRDVKILMAIHEAFAVSRGPTGDRQRALLRAPRSWLGRTGHR